MKLYNKIIVLLLILMALIDFLIGSIKSDVTILISGIFLLLIANTDILVHKS